MTALYSVEVSCAGDSWCLVEWVAVRGERASIEGYEGVDIIIILAAKYA